MPCCVIFSYASLKLDLAKSLLQRSMKLTVMKGDHYGFTWIHGGVVKFDFVRTKSYCTYQVIPQLGSTLTATSNPASNRIYSIQVNFKPSCGKCSLRSSVFVNDNDFLSLQSFHMKRATDNSVDDARVAM